jgi:Tfp pilus assembly protein PilP
MRFNKLSLIWLAAAAIVGTAAPALAQSDLSRSGAPAYTAAGRRDPFKNLFSGQELKERRPVTRVDELMIDDVQIMGIVKAKARWEVILSISDGFPMTAREGDRFADGYVLSIREDAVIFRKTVDRGMPLLKPKDIIKEINPEERNHE